MAPLQFTAVSELLGSRGRRKYSIAGTFDRIDALKMIALEVSNPSL